MTDKPKSPAYITVRTDDCDEYPMIADLKKAFESIGFEMTNKSFNIDPEGYMEDASQGRIEYTAEFRRDNPLFMLRQEIVTITYANQDMDEVGGTINEEDQNLETLETLRKDKKYPLPEDLIELLRKKGFDVLDAGDHSSAVKKIELFNGSLEEENVWYGVGATLQLWDMSKEAEDFELRERKRKESQKHDSQQ